MSHSIIFALLPYKRKKNNISQCKGKFTLYFGECFYLFLLDGILSSFFLSK